MGADLFESYVGAIIGTMVLGAIFISVIGISAVLLPLIIAGAGVLLSISVVPLSILALLFSGFRVL